MKFLFYQIKINIKIFEKYSSLIGWEKNVRQLKPGIHQFVYTAKKYLLRTLSSKTCPTSVYGRNDVCETLFFFFFCSFKAFVSKAWVWIALIYMPTPSSRTVPFRPNLCPLPSCSLYSCPDLSVVRSVSEVEACKMEADACHWCSLESHLCFPWHLPNILVHYWGTTDSCIDSFFSM